MVLQCLDIRALDDKWHEINTPSATYCLLPYLPELLPEQHLPLALATGTVFSGSHNCSSVVCRLLQAGIPKGACNDIQPGLPVAQCHESQSGRRLCMHSWAEPGGDNWFTPSDAAKFAMRLKQQEVSMLSCWLGVDVEIQAHKVHTMHLTRVAIAEDRPINAFDWAPTSWFQTKAFLSSGRSECKPEDWANSTLRCRFARGSESQGISYFERLAGSASLTEEQLQEIQRELNWCERTKVSRLLCTLDLKLSRWVAQHEKTLMNAMIERRDSACGASGEKDGGEALLSIKNDPKRHTTQAPPARGPKPVLTPSSCEKDGSDPYAPSSDCQEYCPESSDIRNHSPCASSQPVPSCATTSTTKDEWF